MDFFSPDRIRINLTTDRPQTCSRCGLWRNKRHPRMEPFGDFKRGILNIGEAPGETEDNFGRQWQGKMGKVLQHAYKRLGIDLFRDCININAVNCRPTNNDGSNRTPTEQEINNCRNKVIEVINKYKPKVIMLLGNAAMKCIIGGRWRKDLGKLGRWVDWPIPDRDFNAWIYCTYHPSFMERGDQELETIWTQHLERGLSLINKPLPHYKDERKRIIIIKSLESIYDRIRSPFAFDYETTGLKPQRDGHRVVCGSLCFDREHAFAFMMTKENRRLFRKILKDREYAKIAENMKFEHSWSQERLKCRVKNWMWDTMLAAHVLDNRPWINSLKFQVYVNFGLIDYDSGVSNYLGTDKKLKGGGNAFNRIDELLKTTEGEEKLLTYCGLDSLFEYRLAMRQMKQFGKDYEAN